MAVICSALGTALLIILVLACLPFTVPKMFGFHIYTVVSGSMEPAIPTGSLVYVKEVPAEDIEKEDIIAFYSAMDTTSIITHRVVGNSATMGEFITKGDANHTKDMNPVSYDHYIGKLVLSVPKVGRIAQVFASAAGKIAAVSLIGVSVLLEILASLINKRSEKN